MRGLDGVGRGQVVVLAGVDDDPGAGVHLAAEPLVDEGADRVDVAEEDAVHRVVEHHVEALETGQRGDLGHAQAGGVVGQPDVAAELPAGLVEGGAHQPEVLLGGIGAGEALPGGALGHVVQQRLAGRPDHRDHVGTLAGGLLGLRDVLVDVTGRDDQVDPRLARGVADALHEALPLAAAGVDAAYAGRDLLAARGARPAGVATLGDPEPDRAGRGLLGERPEVLGVAAQQRVPDGQGEPVLEADVGAHRVGQPVHPGGAVGVGAGQAGQAQGGALHRDGGVLLGHRDDRAADLAGERCGARRTVAGSRSSLRSTHSLRSNRPADGGLGADDLEREVGVTGHVAVARPPS